MLCCDYPAQQWLLPLTVQILLLKDNTEDIWLFEMLLMIWEGNFIIVIKQKLENDYDYCELNSNGVTWREIRVSRSKQSLSSRSKQKKIYSALTLNHRERPESY